MEHTHRDPAMAVAARFMRLRWRRPLKVAGGALALGFSTLILAGFTPLDNRGRHLPEPGQALVDGTVTSLDARQVGSPFSGAVSQVAVHVGDRVKKGQLLFQMDPQILREQLAQVIAEKNAAVEEYQKAQDARDAEVRKAQETVAALGADLSRAQQPLIPAAVDNEAADYESEDGADQPAQPDQAAPLTLSADAPSVGDLQLRLTEARAEADKQAKASEQSLLQLRQNCDVAARRVSQAQTLLDGAARRSPMDGVVSRVDVEAGTMVEACVPLVQVDNPSGFRIVSPVNEKVRQPLKAGVLLPVQLPEGRVAGTLEKIEDGYDRQLFTYFLWVKPDQPERLLPGQTVAVSIPAETKLVASR